MVHIATSFRWCAGAIRRAGYLSVLNEFVFVTLRKPKVSFVLKSAALSGAIVAVSVGFSALPPTGYAKNSVQTATNGAFNDNVTATPATAVQQITFVPPPPKYLDRLITARSGDTFMKLMTGATVSRTDAHSAITAMREVYNPRDLRPGQTLTARFESSDEAGQDQRFVGLSFKLTVDRTVQVSRTEAGAFKANLIERELDHRVAHLGGSIDASLYPSESSVDSNSCARTDPHEIMASATAAMTRLVILVLHLLLVLLMHAGFTSLGPALPQMRPKMRPCLM